MPVEIRELVIRAVATADDQKPIVSPQASPADQEEIVQECVKQVLRILKKEKER